MMKSQIVILWAQEVLWKRENSIYFEGYKSAHMHVFLQKLELYATWTFTPREWLLHNPSVRLDDIPSLVYWGTFLVPCYHAASNIATAFQPWDCLLKYCRRNTVRILCKAGMAVKVLHTILCANLEKAPNSPNGLYWKRENIMRLAKYAYAWTRSFPSVSPLFKTVSPLICSSLVDARRNRFCVQVPGDIDQSSLRRIRTG